MNVNGVININKEAGYTSQDVVSVVRRILGGVKAGHTGTLDPMATGVLPVCVGRATKIADYIQAGDKEYAAVMRLGVVTDTEDTTGAIISRTAPVADHTRIQAAVQSFANGYMQTPPMYSAVKIDGRRLYKLARGGATIDRPARFAAVYGIDVVSVAPPDVSLVVRCGKGVYIRTLIADIGAALGCGACMADLVRTRTGKFHIGDAFTLSAVETMTRNVDMGFIRPVDDVLDYQKIHIMPDITQLLYNGNKLPLGAVNPAPAGDVNVFVYDNDKLCGIYKPDGDFLRPVTMLTDTRG